MKYGQRVGRGQWGAQAASGGGRMASPERGGEGAHPVPHKSRAPARSVRRPIAERVGRWPEEEGGVL
jgi:hypothetical protein